MQIFFHKSTQKVLRPANHAKLKCRPEIDVHCLDGADLVGSRGKASSLVPELHVLLSWMQAANKKSGQGGVFLARPQKNLV